MADVKEGVYQVVKEGSDEVLRVEAGSWGYTPSLEDNSLVMGEIVDRLVESPGVTKIIFHQQKKFIYHNDQTQMLIEIAGIYNYLIKGKKILSIAGWGFDDSAARFYGGKLAEVQYLILNLLRSDPIGCYVETKRILREERILLERDSDESIARARTGYIALLSEMSDMLKKTRLIQIVEKKLDGRRVGERDIYREVFRAVITPDFMYTRLKTNSPIEGEELDFYSLGENEIGIFRMPGDIKNYYHLVPVEHKLKEDEYELLDIARNVLAGHKPRNEEFLDPARMRTTFLNIGRDLLDELARNKGYEISYERINQLAQILVRYTVGFGLIEILLQDQKVQDITINSPIGKSPIFLVHEEFGDCYTNITPSFDDAESWATKFRLLSGRPLDEANAILDTELSIPGARSRVAVMTKPLSPEGLAFAMRRHRDRPWTLPLFINNGMISPLAAGMISFLIDGARTMLVAGTRSSGKTSLLGSFLVEIMRKYRVITIEDSLELPVNYMRSLGYNIQNMKVRSALTKAGAELSADDGIRTSLRLGDSSLIVGEVRSSIRGNEDVLIVDKGKTKLVKIKDLEGADISNILVPSLDFDLKFKLKKLTAFVKHPKRKNLLEVTTRTGRKITVTPDHSLFTYKDFRVLPIECNSLKQKDKIIIPEKLPIGYNEIEYIDLFDFLEDENCRLVNYEEDLREIIKKIGYKKASQITNTSNDVYQYLRKGREHTNIPITAYRNLAQKANYPISLQKLEIKTGTSNSLQAHFPINLDFCRFLGYYASEGYTSNDGGSIIFSNGDKAIIEDMALLCKNLFGISPYVRKTFGLGESTQIVLSNKILALLLKKLGCGRVALEKRIPSILFGLSEDKICEFLKGYFDGDGTQNTNISGCNSIESSTVSKGLANDLLYLLLGLGIVARVRYERLRGIGKNESYKVIIKQKKYVELFLYKIGFKKYKKEIIKRGVSHSTLNTLNYNKEILEKNIKINRRYRHLRRNFSCGKDYLKKVIEESKYSTDLIRNFANGDFYLDEIKSIKEISLDEGEYVYDLSVDPCQNFIGGFGGILLHNTEAKALYEAMRIGALANVVAGTIHGADPYSVFDRVVNDLGVPKTSFKATDVIIVANPVKSADGLNTWKRVLQIAEVRKHWKDDPLAERGFVDLFKYDGRKDELVPTADLLNGESEVVKAVAGNVREWVGNWDAVWENILLRAKIKKSLVEFANRTKNNEILESNFVVTSNDVFHRLIEKVRDEVGSIDSKRVYFEWEDWARGNIKLAKRI